MPGFLLRGSGMYDSNWDLIDGEVAHQIEVLNYSSQVNLIEAFIRFTLHKHPPMEGQGSNGWPTEYALREIHRTGTQLLLHKPGEYREGEVHVARADGSVVHKPPQCEHLQEHMSKFFQMLSDRWATGHAVELCGFSLWMLNWVHPFKNGNGRTARAFAYACLSLKLGFVLPGAPTVIDLIMQNRDEYQTALKAADIAYEASGEPDLGAMNAFIHRLVVEQLSSIPAGG